MKEKTAFETLVFEALDRATEGIEPPDSQTEEIEPKPRPSFVLSIAEYIEEQVKNQRPAYQFLDKVSFYSHRGIKALTEGDFNEFALCEERLKEAWGGLGELNLPKDILWRFDSDSGQEIVEMDLVCFFWPCVRTGEVEPLKIRHYSMFHGIKPQAWLAGLGDAASEVGKVMVNCLYANRTTLSVQDQLAMRDRYVRFLSAVHEKVSEYKGTPGNIINNNRRRGQGFDKILNRINRFIHEAMERQLLVDNVTAILREGGVK